MGRLNSPLRHEDGRGLDQVSPTGHNLLTLTTGLLLATRDFPPEEAASADDLVDADVADVDGGEDDEEAEGGREEDQQAGGDDLGQRTGTHLAGKEVKTWLGLGLAIPPPST